MDIFVNIGELFEPKRNMTNNQKVVPSKYNIVVEDSMVRVDFLKNRINTLTKAITNDDVLKATTTDHLGFLGKQEGIAVFVTTLLNQDGS